MLYAFYVLVHQELANSDNTPSKPLSKVLLKTIFSSLAYDRLISYYLSMDIVKIEPSKAPNYAATLVSIYKDVWLANFPSIEAGISRADLADDFSDLESRVSIWRDRILANSARTLWILQTEGDMVVGFCIATRQPGHHELDFVFILPEYQRKGYGSKLIQKALVWLGDDEPISLEVAKHNTDAITLYRKFGFEVGGPIEARRLKNGKLISWIQMVRA